MYRLNPKQIVEPFNLNRVHKNQKQIGLCGSVEAAIICSEYGHWAVDSISHMKCEK